MPVSGIYLTIRQLPNADRPALLRRFDGKCLLAVDPRDSRQDIAAAAGRLLLAHEGAAIRAAFGATPQDIDPALVADVPALLYVPESLRLPGEAALQGGAELERRTRAGLLNEEYAMFATEAAMAEVS